MELEYEKAMKRLFMVLLSVLAAAAQAQQLAPTLPASDHSIDQRFRQADTNGDGVISPAEARAAGLWFKNDFSSVDTDRSGTVTLAEIAAALSARLTRSMSEFDAADLDHDGRLSEEEVQRSPGILDALKPIRRESEGISRPEYESYTLDRIYRSTDLPSVAPNIIEKKF